MATINLATRDELKFIEAKLLSECQNKDVLQNVFHIKQNFIAKVPIHNFNARASYFSQQYTSNE